MLLLTLMNSIHNTLKCTDSSCHFFLLSFARLCVCCYCVLFHCISNHFSFLNKRTFVLLTYTHADTQSACCNISQFLRGLHLFCRNGMEVQKRKKKYTHIEAAQRLTVNMFCVMANEIGFFHETYAIQPARSQFLSSFAVFFWRCYVALSPNIIIIEPHNCITGV